MRRPVASLALVLALGLAPACRGVERQPRLPAGPELEAVADPADRRRIALAVEDLYGTPDEPRAPEGSGLDLVRVRRGRALYYDVCVHCHGGIGGGDGPLGQRLSPRPRDYRRGVFKFTSTAPGARALRSDLVATLRRGVPPKMPSFALVEEGSLQDTVELVLWFSERGEVERRLVAALEPGSAPSQKTQREAVTTTGAAWAAAETQVAVRPSRPPPLTAELAKWGRELFLSKEAGCVACHGAEGRGHGPSAAGLKDDWGEPIVPRDLTAGIFKGGSEPADVFRSIACGLKGTPMPAFKEALGSEQIWNLVAYVRSLAESPR